MTTTLEGGERSASHPGRSLPPGKTRYPLYRRLGGPQGWSGQARKISSPLGFDPRTIQPVSSYYTDYDTRLTIYIYIYIYIKDKALSLPWVPASQQKIIRPAKQNYHFFFLPKLLYGSQNVHSFKNTLQKHRKSQTYKIMKINSRCKSH